MVTTVIMSPEQAAPALAETGMVVAMTMTMTALEGQRQVGEHHPPRKVRRSSQAQAPRIRRAVTTLLPAATMGTGSLDTVKHAKRSQKINVKKVMPTMARAHIGMGRHLFRAALACLAVGCNSGGDGEQVMRGVLPVTAYSQVFEAGGYITGVEVSPDGRVVAVATLSKEGDGRYRRSWSLLASDSLALLRSDFFLIEGTGRPREIPWVMIDDIEGDGLPDLLYGEPHSNSVKAISTSGTGKVLFDRQAPGPNLFGKSLCVVGDVDSDGVYDFAVGAPQVDARAALLAEVKEARYEDGVFDVSGETLWLADGTVIGAEAYANEAAERLGPRTGYVDVCSGKTGFSLGRIDGTRPGWGFGWDVRVGADHDVDGLPEIVVHYCPLVVAAPAVVSAVSETVVDELIKCRGRADVVGDVDGDGLGDYVIDHRRTMSSAVFSPNVTVVSTARKSTLCHLRVPEETSDAATKCGIGDIDGDGRAEIAIGDPNYRPLDGEGLFSLPLSEVVKLPASKTRMGDESGCVVVYSLHEGMHPVPIVGLFADPSSSEGFGFCVRSFEGSLQSPASAAVAPIVVADRQRVYRYELRD